MNLGLLALRLVAGLTFAGHGAQKLFGVFGGAGLEKTAAGFDRMGLRPGKLHAPLAGGAELFGGLALALGLLTPFAAAALVGVMTAAVIAVHLRNGFWNTNGGFEFNLVLAAAVFALAAVGAGAWSLDGAFGIDLTGTGWALGALGAGLVGGMAAVAEGRLYTEHKTRRAQPSAIGRPAA
jgi:putative oxidoreductase